MPDARSTTFGLFLFLLAFGFLLQIAGIVQGPLNDLIAGKEYVIQNPLGSGDLLKIPFAPTTLTQMLGNILTILGIYYGASFFIGLFKGGYSPGFDFQFFAKVVLIATLYTVVAPVFQIFTFLYSLGDIGRVLATFMGIVYFLTAFGILYTHAV